MKVLDKINIFLEQSKFAIDSDDPLFKKLADLVISLKPEKLTDKQLKKVVEIIEDLEFEPEKKNEEVKAKKELATKKQYANSYYRKNKGKIKKKKEDLEKSIEGQKRNRMMPIMAKQRKTATGRRKVSYHTYKR